MGNSNCRHCGKTESNKPRCRSCYNKVCRACSRNGKCPFGTQPQSKGPGGNYGPSGSTASSASHSTSHCDGYGGGYGGFGGFGGGGCDGGGFGGGGGCDGGGM